MEKVDRRVQRTHELLGNALVALTLEKGFDAVTIRDITERANVGYVTFFRHFDDKNALFLKMLEDVAQGMGIPFDDGFHCPLTEDIAQLWFKHIQENADFLRAVLDASALRKHWREGLAKIMRTSLKDRLSDTASSRLSLELAANHLASSFLNFMEWWLDHQTSYSVEEVAKIYHQLVVAPTLALS